MEERNFNYVFTGYIENRITAINRDIKDFYYYITTFNKVSQTSRAYLVADQQSIAFLIGANKISGDIPFGDTLNSLYKTLDYITSEYTPYKAREKYGYGEW